MRTDYCAECGEALVPIHGTARLQCCDGMAYWSTVTPLPGATVVKHGKYTLYIEHVKWRIHGKGKPVPPNTGDDDDES